jgi:hypothetical protein
MSQRNVSKARGIQIPWWLKFLSVEENERVVAGADR